MNSLPRWQRWSFAISAVAIVAGLSFIISLSGRPDPVLDRLPEDLVQQLPTPEQALPQNGSQRGGGGVLVLPSEILAEGVGAGLRLPPITIENRSTEEQRIAVQFIPVKRTLIGGAPVLEPTASNIAAGRELISLDREKLTLAPQESTTVTPTIVGRPADGILIGSVATTVIDQQPDISGPTKNDVRIGVQNNIRINSMVYLSWPEAVDQQATLERVRATQDEDGALQFKVRVRGGSGVSSPQGQITVFSQNGQQVAATSLDGSQRVIPEAERDLTPDRAVDPLPPGRYQAQVQMTAGPSRQTVIWPFTIDASGKLPAPKAAVALQAEPTTIKAGGSSEIFIQVENRGSKNFAPQGALRLYRFGSEQVLDQRPLKFNSLAPGDIDETTQSITAPPRPGNYEVVVDLEAEDGTFLDQRVVSFMVAGQMPAKPGLIDRFRDWISENPLGALAVAILGLGLLIAVIAGGAALLGRSRRL